jgi:hypothetical protein
LMMEQISFMSHYFWHVVHQIFCKTSGKNENCTVVILSFRHERSRTEKARTIRIQGNNYCLKILNGDKGLVNQLQTLMLMHQKLRPSSYWDAAAEIGAPVVPSWKQYKSHQILGGIQMVKCQVNKNPSNWAGWTGQRKRRNKWKGQQRKPK